MNYHHILAAFDGSEVAEKALHRAVDLASRYPGSKLYVAYVRHWPQFAALGYGFVQAAHIEKDMEAHEAALNSKIKEVTAALPYVETAVLSGEPAAEIVKFAETNRCDLIVIGNRGHGPFKEMMLGSVSHHVVQRAAVPVLIVK
jgi:nucleotide-binding universal stress UspA family protein